MTNTASKQLSGSVLLDSSTAAADAEAITRGTITAHIEGTLIGDVTQQILIAVPQTGITVTAIRVYPSLAISKGATLPVVTLVQSDLAKGTNTAIGTVIDLTAVAFVERTAVSGVVSAGGVAADVGISVLFTKSSTGAVVGDCKMTMLVDYDLTV